MNMILNWRNVLLLAMAGLVGHAGAVILDPAPMQVSEAELNKMLEYQIFGEDYLTAGARFRPTNPKGYVGSNKTVSLGDDATVAPTVVINGTTSNPGSLNVSIRGVFSAPVMVKGDINLTSGTSAFNDLLASYSTPSPSSATGTGSRIYTEAGWSAAQKNSITDHTIPSLNATCASDHPTLNSALDLTVGNDATREIDVSGYQYAGKPDTVVDICVNNISLGSQSTLIFKTFPGQLVRVFAYGNLSQGAGVKIGISNGSGAMITSDQYKGNLLVYVNGMWTGALNSTFMGTYIQRNNTFFASGNKLTGQILSKGITFQNDFNGSVFRYVPFNPPVVDPTIELDGTDPLSEDLANNVRTLTILLDKPAIVAVSMTYTFNFDLASSPAVLADLDMLSKTGAVEKVLTGTLDIPVGASSATLYISVFDDAIAAEGFEYFSLTLSDIYGAVFPGGQASITQVFQIIDNDDNAAPTTQNGTVTATEDVVFSFASSDFYYLDPAPSPTAFSSISIRSQPNKGTLFYDADNDGAFDTGEEVTLNQPILVANIPKLKFITDLNGNGPNYANFLFTVSDGSLSSTQATMTIDVTNVNDAPTLAAIAAKTMLEDVTSTVTLTVGDVDGIPATQPTAVSSNLTLFPSGSITASGTGASRTLTLNPAADQNGTASITVSFTDGTTTVTRVFDVSVTAVNDAPSFTVGDDQTIIEQTAATPQSVNGWNTIRSAGPTNESSQTLTFEVTANTNTGLFAATPVISSSGTLTYTPNANISGVATITVRIRDSGANGGANGDVNVSTTQTFKITITDVNNVPSFTLNTATITVLEDAAGVQSFVNRATSISAGPNETQGLTFNISTDNDALFSVKPAINSTTGTLTFTLAANAWGVANVTVTLSDNGSPVQTSSSQSFVINVTQVNDAPTYSKTGAALNHTVNEDAGAQTVNSWAGTLTNGPLDPTTQILSFGISSNSNIALFSSQPTINAAGQLKYTPNANANGFADIVFYLKDDGLTANSGKDQTANATFRITVNPVNDPPTAVADGASTQMNQQVTIPIATLLANDIDVDGNTLTIVSPINNASSVNGTAVISGLNVIFTPTTNFQNGTGSFQYTVTDGTLTSTTTVTIAVDYANAAPVFKGIANFDTNEDVQLNLDGGATDADGDPLTYSLVTYPTGMTINPTTGLISWKPTNAQVSGTAYTVTARVRDPLNIPVAADMTFTIKVQNVNDAPVLTVANVSTNEDVASAITVTAADEDLVVPTVTEVLTYTLGGTVPAGMTISKTSATTASISWNPTNAQVGVHTITVIVTDAIGATDTKTFTWTVTNVNDAPTLAAIADQFVDQDDLLTVSAVGSDIDVADTKTYELINEPTGMVINSSSGSITWTPKNEDVRALPYDVTVRVTDSKGLFAEQSFQVTVNNINDAPVFAAIPNASVNEKEFYSYQATATDIDFAIDPNETQEFLLLNGPAGLTVSITGQIAWTPGASAVGAHTVKLMVSDLAGASDTVSYTLTVLNVNDAPTFATIADTSTLEDVKFTRTIKANDPDAGDVLTYTFIAKPVGMVINSSTGVVTWNPGNSDVGPHVVTVRAKDKAGAFVDVTFTLTVVNVNDAPVIEPATMTVTENTPKGTYVGQVSATDIDAGSVVSYFLVKNDKFTVTVDGTIKINKPLDYETAKVETLLVAVTDGFAYDTARVIVSVTNVEEKSVVEIIKVVEGEKTWTKPDTVWTNEETVDVTWTKDGVSALDRTDVREGVNVIVKEYKGPTMDTYGRDTVIVLVNRTPPEIKVVLPPDRPEPKPNTVIEDPFESGDTTERGDTIYFINDGEKTIFAQVITVGKDLKLDTILIRMEPDLVEGLNTVKYTYTDAFGNIATDSVPVFLDLTPPVVKIVRPADSTRTVQFVVPVSWTVDGVPMDTLNQQSLVVGWNQVIRAYRDKAGNEASDTVWVYLKNKNKDVDIVLEDALVILDQKKIDKFYQINPPRDDEYFALSLVNTVSGREEEKKTGMGKNTQVGDDKEPYPGLMGKHLGPTLRLEIKLPHMGGYDAAGKPRGGDIQSIMEPDGRIALDAGAGEDRTLVTLSEYIEKNCLKDAFKGMSPGEILEASLVHSKILVEVMVYDAIGQFVDNMQVTQEITSSKYLSDAGRLTAYMEIKPRKGEGLKNQRGRSYATGAYVMRGRVESISTNLCDTPTGLAGEKTKNSAEVLDNFGFRREPK